MTRIAYNKGKYLRRYERRFIEMDAEYGGDNGVVLAQSVKRRPPIHGKKTLTQILPRNSWSPFATRAVASEREYGLIFKNTRSVIYLIAGLWGLFVSLGI